MCANDKCPLKETCYRFKATPNTYQTYSSYTYELDPRGKVVCDGYMKIIKYDKRIKR
jgi:hypothetical protein